MTGAGGGWTPRAACVPEGHVHGNGLRYWAVEWSRTLEEQCVCPRMVCFCFQGGQDWYQECGVGGRDINTGGALREDKIRRMTTVSYKTSSP